MVVSRNDDVQCTCGRRGARDPRAAACREACGGAPTRETKSSEGKGGVTPGERALGFPNRPSRGLHLRSPLRDYPTASCGACPPTSRRPETTEEGSAPTRARLFTARQNCLSALLGAGCGALSTWGRIARDAGVSHPPFKVHNGRRGSP